MTEYWWSSRQTFLLTSHWRSFVPSQKEIKWDTEVSAMFCCLSYIYCGFVNGGLVKHSRHDQAQIFFIIAHSNSNVIQLDASKDLLVTAGSDKIIKIWTNIDGQMLCQISQTGTATDIKIASLLCVFSSKIINFPMFMFFLKIIYFLKQPECSSSPNHQGC